MNPGPSDYLDRIQLDTHDLLRGVPALALANHFLQDEGDIEVRIKRALNTLDDKSGRLGLAIITLLPTVTLAEPNLPGPLISITQEVQVIEQVMINRDATRGTGLRSSSAALAVLSALHLQTVGQWSWRAAKDPIEPVAVKSGYLSYAVRLLLHLAVPPNHKPAGVHPEIDEDGIVSLSCATAGSGIHYTLDGTLPRPLGASSHLYTSPIGPFPAGTVVRAAAYLPDANPGDVIEFSIKA